MKEEDVVHEVTPAASSTLVKDEKIGMSKIVEEVAAVSSIYDIDCRNLAKAHEFSTEEDLSGKVNLVLDEPIYNMRRNRNDDHADYDVVGLSDMKEMIKVLRDLMKPEFPTQVFCFTLYFAS